MYLTLKISKRHLTKSCSCNSGRLIPFGLRIRTLLSNHHTSKALLSLMAKLANTEVDNARFGLITSLLVSSFLAMLAGSFALGLALAPTFVALT